MPFTLSHAAAVLPAVRRTGEARGRLVASALVAGALAPDMTYYADSVVPGGMAFGAVTHAWWGVLTVDVSISVALVCSWLLLREPLLVWLPRAWRGRVYGVVRGRPWQPQGWRELAALCGWFVLSAVLGSATHVVWDAFTHPGRWGTRLVPGLDGELGGWPVATYVQYGTSLPALAVTVWFVWSALRRRGVGGEVPAGVRPFVVAELTVRDRLLLGALVTVGVLGGVVHRVLRAHAVYGGAAGWFSYVPTALFGAGAGLVLGLLVCAVAVRLLVRRARPDGPNGAAAAGAPAGAATDGATAAPADPVPGPPADTAADAAAGPSAVASTAD
ncbi:DUF4184 family protein [Streptomyces sp. NPDC056411]|uniref:DUF4184 family protein n=1 Tax=Streptomyces sp. NPDC056411 TaxID=3345813 RepID=UPI0035DE8FA6